MTSALLTLLTASRERPILLSMATKNSRTRAYSQNFLDDCFSNGCLDADWYKHHGVVPYGPSVQVAGKRIYLSDAVAVANYRRGWRLICEEYPL